MTAHSPLEQALEVWNRQAPDRQTQIDDAVMLGETGVFSKRHISFITGLDLNLVNELVRKPDKTGGRFNPEALPLILDLSLGWRQNRVCDAQLTRTIVAIGVSPFMISKLSGISRTTLYRKLNS
jgi:hypothetical protein